MAGGTGKHQAEWVAQNGRGRIQALGLGVLSYAAVAASIVVALPHAREPEVYAVAAQVCVTGTLRYIALAAVAQPNTSVVVAVGRRRPHSTIVALVDGPLGIAAGV